MGESGTAGTINCIQIGMTGANSDKRAGADGPTKLVSVQTIVLTEQVLSIASALHRGDKRCWCWYIQQHAELQVSGLVCIAEEELI
jgi:hypothetical protein